MAEPTIYEKAYWRPTDGLKAAKDWPAAKPVTCSIPARKRLVSCEYASCTEKFVSGSTDCAADCHCAKHCATESHVRYCKNRATR